MAQTIAIAATDQNDAHVLNTCFAPASNNTIDFSAPGQDIATVDSASDTADDFDTTTGTSFAAPLVSATAALARALYPSMTQDQFYDYLKDTVIDLAPTGKDGAFGWGRLQADDTLDAVPQLLFEDGFESGDTTSWSSTVP